MRVAVVLKRTTYSKFVLEEHDPLLARLLRNKDATVSRLKHSHEAHEACVREVETALRDLGATTVFEGGPHARIPKVDLVVTIGGDGTLLAASHQLGPGIPLLGVNSAPDSSIGFFCGATNGSVRKALAAALAGKLGGVELSRMRVDVNGRTVHARVLNETLVCHSSPAATSRYILRVTRADGTFREEEQKSSGMWIGPAAGSTAAQRSAGGKVLPLTSKRVQYVVREPYIPIGKRMRLLVGLLDAGGTLTLRSKMRQAKLFVDGNRFEHDLTLGDVLVMRRSPETLTVLGIADKRRS